MNTFKNRRVLVSTVFLILAVIVSLLIVVKVSATGNNITGHVTNPAGSSVNGAYVYATAPSSSTVVYGPVTTNSSGNYTLIIPTSGTFDIHIDPPANTGYVPYTDGSVSVTTNLVINEQFTAQTRTLSGTLKDSASNAISGATIKLFEGSNTYQTTTDSSGNYSISAPAGYGYLYIIGGDSTVGLSFTLSQSNTSSINLVNGNLTLNLVIQTATLSITAYNDGGQVGLHAANGIVIARATSGIASLYPGDPGTTISIANSGSFSNSPTGTFTTIVGATYAALGLGANTSSNSICESTTIASNYDCLVLPLTVTGNASVSVPQTSPATRTYTGVLTDGSSNPIVGATVTVLQNGENTATATTDSTGTFTINAMPKKYYLVVSANNVDGMTGFTLTQLYSNPTIDLTGSSGIQNLQVNTATLTITADDSSGNPNFFTNVNIQTSAGSASLYTGDPGESMLVSSVGFITSPTTPPYNVGTTGTIVGASYSAKGLGVSNPNGSICDRNSTNWDCLTTALTVTGSSSLNVPF